MLKIKDNVDLKELENAVIDGKMSHIGIYNPNGSSILYTEEYVKEKDKEIERLNNIMDLVVKDMEMTKYNPELPTYNSCVAVDKDHIQQWIDKLKEGK